ncbi:MAG TPA: hypothetical protein VN368_00440 [Candidatus Methylomirabilis sp.]|nr:hypothetical protein [Candidatus Methylomirabilis sp.]
MGRTVLSFRMLLEEIIEELSAFRRALHGEDKAAFDRLMNKARKHASSCTVVPTLDPMSAVFLSILVEQEKELKLNSQEDGDIAAGHQVRSEKQPDNKVD